MAWKSITDAGVLRAALNDPPSSARRPGGWAISDQDEPYIIDLGSDPVPAGAHFLGGSAYKENGARYVTSDAPSGAQFIGGQAIRNDGALHITTSDPDAYLGMWGHTEDGAACVDGYVRAVVEGELVSGATFTRSATANYFDSNGIMQEAAVDEARTTYIDGNPYLWIDGSVTEISGKSFDLEDWSSSITASVAKDAVGMDGENNAGFTVTDDNNTVLQSAGETTTITGGTSKYYMVYSIQKVAAPSVYPAMDLRVIGGTTDVRERVVVDPSDGSTAGVLNEGSVVLDSLQIGDYVHGVLSVTDNDTGHTTAVQRVFPAYNETGGTGNDSSLQGSNVVGYCALYKDNFSLMPILTTGGTTATVAADVASLTNSVISSMTEGTIYAEVWSPQLTSNAARHIAELESDANNFVRVFHAADGDLDAQVTTGGASQATLSGTDLTVGTLEKVALAFDGSDYALYRDGTQEATASSGTMPSVDTLLIGAGLYGGIKTLNVYPHRLTNAELASLTT